MNVAVGAEAVLQISVDQRYMTNKLGLDQLFATYGADPVNQTAYGVLYPTIPTQWINGIPYSGHTSTNAPATSTSVHSTDHLNIVLLL